MSQLIIEAQTSDFRFISFRVLVNIQGCYDLHFNRDPWCFGSYFILLFLAPGY